MVLVAACLSLSPECKQSNMRQLMIVVLLITTSGCASLSRSVNHPPFLNHDNLVERTTAGVGLSIGLLVGLPVALVLLPITYPLGQASDQPQAGMLAIAPMGAVAVTVASSVGIAAWPLFGWWQLFPLKDVTMTNTEHRLIGDVEGDVEGYVGQ